MNTLSKSLGKSPPGEKSCGRMLIGDKLQPRPFLAELPNELIELVLGLCAPRAQKSLRQVCTRFKDIAAKFLFSRVVMSKFHRDFDSLCHIAATEDLAKLVKEVVWYELTHDFQALSDSNYTRGGAFLVDEEEAIRRRLYALASASSWINTVGNVQYTGPNRLTISGTTLVEQTRRDGLVCKALARWLPAMRKFDNLQSLVSCAMPHDHTIAIQTDLRDGNEHTLVLTAQMLSTMRKVEARDQNFGFAHFLLRFLATFGPSEGPKRLRMSDEGASEFSSLFLHDCQLLRYKRGLANLTHIDLDIQGTTGTGELVSVVLQTTYALQELKLSADRLAMLYVMSGMTASEKSNVKFIRKGRSRFLCNAIEDNFAGMPGNAAWPTSRRFTRRKSYVVHLPQLRVLHLVGFPVHTVEMEGHVGAFLAKNRSTIKELRFVGCSINTRFLERLARLPLSLHRIEIRSEDSILGHDSAIVIPDVEAVRYVNGGRKPLVVEQLQWQTQHEDGLGDESKSQDSSEGQDSKEFLSDWYTRPVDTYNAETEADDLSLYSDDDLQNSSDSECSVEDLERDELLFVREQNQVHLHACSGIESLYDPSEASSSDKADVQPANAPAHLYSSVSNNAHIMDRPSRTLTKRIIPG